MSDIPYRAYYSIEEACVLRSCGRSYIYEMIAEGTKRFPGPDAILPEQRRQVGRKQTIHRSWVMGEPRNLSPMRPSALTPAQIEDAMAAALVRFAREFIDSVAGSQKRSA